MTTTDALRDIELLIRSRYAIIHLDTDEEDRAESLLRLVADRVGMPIFAWTPTKGLRRLDRPDPVYGTNEPSQVLAHLEAADFPAVYHLCGLGPALEDPLLGRKLLDAATKFARSDGILVITGTDVKLPGAVRPISAHVRLAPPPIGEYRRLLARIVRDLGERMKVKVEMGSAEIDRLLRHIRGLSMTEAEKILTKAIVEDGRLDPADIRTIIQAKKQIIEREGLLEYYPTEETMEDIAGLENLKTWLGKRKGIIADPVRAARFGLSFPKGILLVGVPGCGKSLAAKAVATEWELPLLKLDPANLYNKYIGESERNFKRAMETSERMAPVVLWIDELEKAFASGGEQDGGVSTRVLGTFLSWMQDRKGDVFVVATANDVLKLPPEFLRKGRFDEIFFVDLPGTESRRALFAIHLKRRGQAADRFDLDALAMASEGFSGAEIEQVVVSGLYTAFAEDTPLSTPILAREIECTRPLAHTMGERVHALRKWARGRTVSAH